VSTFFRTGYQSYQEFQREALGGSYSHHESLGKEELDLLDDLEDDERFHERPRRASRWD